MTPKNAIKTAMNVSTLEYYYKHVGKALLEIAFRCSLDKEKGSNRIIILGAHYNAHYFYYKFGFRFVENNSHDYQCAYYLELANSLFRTVNNRVVQNIEGTALYLPLRTIISKCLEYELPYPQELKELNVNFRMQLLAERIITAAEQKDLSIRSYIAWREDYSAIIKQMRPSYDKPLIIFDDLLLPENIIPKLIDNPADTVLIIAGLLAKSFIYEPYTLKISKIDYQDLLQEGQRVLNREIIISERFLN